MPIHVSCTGCQAKLKAPDTAAGKKIKCPKCQTVVPVPAAAEGNGAASAPATRTAGGTPEQWFLQTPDGSQYGPIERAELDQWYGEGRVSADCQLLKSGSTQWQWASEIYKSLTPTAAAATSAASSPSFALAGAQVAASPLSPLTALSPQTSASPLGTAPYGLSPLGSPGTSPLGVMPQSGSLATSGKALPSFTTGGPVSPLGVPMGSNPYATPVPIGGYGYGGYQPRSGLHPMVIVAGIFHILAGTWNCIVCLILAIFGIILLVGGGMFAAAGAAAEEPELQGLSGVIATFGVIGAIILFLFAALVLAYGIFQICTAVGLFKRRRWAQVTSFVFAGLGIVMMFFYLLGAIGLEPISILSLFFELAYVTVVLVGMLLPDATRDFR